ncbi:MAG: hypothetical protein WC140_04470 [Bacteroidales bacterium]
MKIIKKSILGFVPFLLSAVILLSISTPSQAKVPVGKYNGELKITLDNKLIGRNDNHAVRIKTIKDNVRYSILLDEFQVANFNVSALKTYVTAKQAPKGDVKIAAKIKDNTGSFEITGTVEGIIHPNKTVELIYNLHFGKMPKTITCFYKGTLNK